MALSELFYIKRLGYGGGFGTPGSLESRMITGSDWVQWQSENTNLLTGKAITVAVLDQGIAIPYHPCLPPYQKTHSIHRRMHWFLPKTA